MNSIVRMMVSKAVFITFMAMLAMTNARLLSLSDTKAMVPLEKESRTLLELPFFGVITLKTLKVMWFFISSAVSVISYKLAILAIAAKAVIWAFENKFTILFGTALAFGFCNLTHLCSWHTKEDFLGYNDQLLLYAAKNLDSGINKYSDRN